MGGPLGTRVTGDCHLPDTGAGNGTQVWGHLEPRQALLALEPFLQPGHSFLDRAVPSVSITSMRRSAHGSLQSCVEKRVGRGMACSQPG